MNNLLKWLNEEIAKDVPCPSPHQRLITLEMIKKKLLEENVNVLSKFEHPKVGIDGWLERYGNYYSGYHNDMYHICPSPLSNPGPQTFYWFCHMGVECDGGAYHPNDHGREKTFEEAVYKAEAFVEWWNNPLRLQWLEHLAKKSQNQEEIDFINALIMEK
jgi:hypothetical protein